MQGRTIDRILVLCLYGKMKTTLDLPDELMREIKVLAAKNDRKLKDLMTELLKEGLHQLENEKKEENIVNRIQFPLISPPKGCDIPVTKMNAQECCDWMKETLHHQDTDS